MRLLEYGVVWIYTIALSAIISHTKVAASELRMQTVPSCTTLGADEANPVGPGIRISHTSYSVVSIIGEQVPDDTLLIVSGGTDTLTYSAWPETGSWLTLAGETISSPAPGDTALVFLQYDPSGLGIGTHYDTVTIASDDPLNPALFSKALTGSSFPRERLLAAHTACAWSLAAILLLFLTKTCSTSTS